MVEHIPRLTRQSIRPGPGWSKLAGAVYQHRTGLRIHIYGLCWWIGGRLVRGRLWPESQWLDLFIRANGGNRRRGVMAWAKFTQARGSEAADA